MTHEKTVSLLKVNIWGLSIGVVLFFILVTIFYSLFNQQIYLHNKVIVILIKEYGSYTFLGSLISLYLVGIILHELIHGIFIIFYAKNGINSLKFGINWRLITPYALCLEPITIKQYRIIASMPCIILGLIPLIGAFGGNGNIYLFAWGLVFTIVSIGDMIAVYLTFGLNSTTKIMEHKTKVGFYILSENS